MTVKDLLNNSNFKLATCDVSLDKEIESFYMGDLLSWVMGNAEAHSAWVTIQGHLNIVAVGHLIEVSCIIVAEGAAVGDDTLSKANKEDIPILTTGLTAYEVAKIFALM